ncbi:LysM peptidoglycan-binding domain-containing protein [Paenibacillus chitinolyticus]|uniref:LysM peptidoglycan-binding domain-containing protein n=1 Tax=Paenibacillus chitinolyticus TaxID=79263 RepID=UPI002DBA9367|nr:LysM peptidoglycan-binding domain-containing protein [Paenibacillus chitinolyticus]MEC0247744.1 LysM peptidoglycan-binding domain-containing protein [Paenibacillus chitinolyticus]
MKIHMVKKGDSLYKIAQKYNVDLDKLIEANPQIANPDQINVGEKVKIPGTPTKPHHHEGQHHEGQHHEGHHHEEQYHEGQHHEEQHHEEHHHEGDHHEEHHHLVKHIVQQGDTLWKLSKAWGIPLKEMIEANTQLKNPSVLMTGETVYIPKKGHKEQEGVQGYQPHHGGTAHGKKNTSPIQPAVPVPEVVEQKPEVVQIPELPEINQITKITEINLNLAKVTENKEEVKIELPVQPMPQVQLPVIEQPPVQPAPQPPVQPPVPEYQLPQLVLPQIELPSYTPQPPPQHPCEPVVPAPYPAYVKEAEAIPDCGGYPEILPMIQPCPPYAPFVSPYGHHHDMWKKEPCGCDGELPVPYGHHGAYEGGWGQPQTLPYPNVEIPQGIPSYQTMVAAEEEFIQPAGQIQVQPYPSQPWFPSQPGLYGGAGAGPDLNTPYTDGAYCAEKPVFGQEPGCPEPYAPFGHGGFEHGGYGHVSGWPQSYEQGGAWPQGFAPQQLPEHGPYMPGGYEQGGAWAQGFAPQQLPEPGPYMPGGYEQGGAWAQGFAPQQQPEPGPYMPGGYEQGGAWAQGFAPQQQPEPGPYMPGGYEQGGAWAQGFAPQQQPEPGPYMPGGYEQGGAWPQGFAPQPYEQQAFTAGLASIPPVTGKKDCGCGGAKKGHGRAPEAANFQAFPSGFAPYAGGAQQLPYTPFTSYGQPDWERICPPAFLAPYGYGTGQEGAVNPYAQFPQPAYAVSGPQDQEAANRIEGLRESAQGTGESEARIHLVDEEGESGSFFESEAKTKKTSAPKKAKTSKSSARTVIRKTGRSTPKQAFSANVPWMNV